MNREKTNAATQRLGVRTAWISDLHLGSPHTHQAWMLNAFYRYVKPETLYQLGDIFDGQDMARHPHWTAQSEEALQRSFHLAANGTTVISIPGNHDYPLRQCLQQQGLPLEDMTQHVVLTPQGDWQPAHTGVSGIHYMQNATYRNSEGLHLLTHGDEAGALDPARHPLVALYDAGYYSMARATALFNRLAPAAPYRNLASGFQRFVCRHVDDFVTSFEARQIERAASLGLQGVFCGHVHTPADKQVSGLRYRNTGSMQVDQSVMIENYDGRIQLLDWGTIAKQLRRTADVPAVLEELAQATGARRLADADDFVFQAPPQWQGQQVYTRHARILAMVTQGPDFARLPVPACA